MQSPIEVRKEPLTMWAELKGKTSFMPDNSPLILALDPERLKIGVALVHVVIGSPGNARAERLVGLAELKKRIKELDQQARRARAAHRGAVTDSDLD